MNAAVVDTSAIIAIFDESYPEHRTLSGLVTSGELDLVLTTFVVAEADYMLQSLLGTDAARRFGRDIVSGAYRLAPWDASDHALALSVCGQYSENYVGIADAANVVLAARSATEVIFTLDQRHFRVLRPLSAAAAFTLLPYDS